METIQALTVGIGVDGSIDAVGVDAECPHHRPAARQDDEFHKKEWEQVAPEQNPDGGCSSRDS